MEKKIIIGKTTFGKCPECFLNKRLRKSGWCWECAWKEVKIILVKIKEDSDTGEGLRVFELSKEALRIIG